MDIINLAYFEILKLHKEYKSKLSSLPKFRIIVLSNITIHQLKEILELILFTHHVNARVDTGNYDNIVQNSILHKDYKVVIIFWELYNLIEGLQYKHYNFSDNQIDDLLSKIKNEISTVLENLENSPLVICNKFSDSAFNYSPFYKSRISNLSSELNAFLDTHNKTNVLPFDTEQIIKELGVEKAFNYREFLKSKILYRIDFLKLYSNLVSIPIFALTGKLKKVLIFDCDNTLWKGIVGEDGINGIKLSSDSTEGKPFAAVQYLAKSLPEQGILIGLCSKNNPEDVDEVIDHHPDFLLKDSIVIKKINWNDKVTNLRSISKDLNLGLDSFVFIDDSEFELNFVKENLPEISCVLVPKNIWEYPIVFRKLMNEFFSLSKTSEDKERVKMYKEHVFRDVEKKKFVNLDDYLASLEIVIHVYEDDLNQVPRLSQMTQKTNQFNLTTKRYTENEILNFVKNKDYLVLSVAVEDKFGDSGITGLAITKIQNNKAFIDTFLQSCRIIGRNIEKKLFEVLVARLKSRGVDTTYSVYIPTRKNSQVENFYESLGFELLESTESKKYRLSLENYTCDATDYIKVING